MVNLHICTITLFFSACGTILVNGLNLTLYERTCYNPVIPVFTTPNSFCTFVTWNTGNLYLRRFFNLYTPGTAITVASRDIIAKRYAETLRKGNDSSSTCNTAIKWLACSSVFPHCPSFSGAASSVSYLEPCRFQCEQVNHACNFDLDCSLYSTTSCTFYVPQSYVVLSPTKVNSRSSYSIFNIFSHLYFVLNPKLGPIQNSSLCLCCSNCYMGFNIRCMGDLVLFVS